MYFAGGSSLQAHPGACVAHFARPVEAMGSSFMLQVKSVVCYGSAVASKRQKLKLEYYMVI